MNVDTIPRDKLRTFWPDDTEYELYVWDSGDVEDVYDSIEIKWPGIRVREVRIERQNIQIPRFKAAQLGISSVLKLFKITRIVGIDFGDILSTL